MHYKRLRRYGSTDDRPPALLRGMKKHPLYYAWRWITKDGDYDLAWRDFWTFVEDVGQRADETYTLRRVNNLLPAGPANFYWKRTAEK